MFRASSAHLQEDIVVYKQHMVPLLSIRVLVACQYAAIGRTPSSPYSCISTGHQELLRVTVPYAAYIQLCPPEDEHLMLETCRGE